MQEVRKELKVKLIKQCHNLSQDRKGSGANKNKHAVYRYSQSIRGRDVE